MLSDMIAAVKKAEADAAALIAQSSTEAQAIMDDAKSKAEDMTARTREKMRSAAAKALFEREEKENALDAAAAGKTDEDAEELRRNSLTHSSVLAEKLTGLMFA